MSDHVCAICQKEVTENKHFWSEHRIKEADYFQKYWPRYSKQTGELIRFKSREFYLTSDFNDKNEMKAWFKLNPEYAKEYSIELLKRRRDLKDLIYAPSEVELRSLMMPSMVWYKSNFDSYNEVCKKLKMESRFDIEDEEIVFDDFPDAARILIDTREQRPLKFRDVITETKTLSYGDYSRSPNRYKVHIERKSLSDFVSTLGVGFERFCREVTRAKRDRAYLIILVESCLNDALHFNHLPQMRFATKSSPDYVFHNVRKLMETYPNVQFLFCKNRNQASDLVKKILAIKQHPKHFDLQYYYDAKRL